MCLVFVETFPLTRESLKTQGELQSMVGEMKQNFTFKENAFNVFKRFEIFLDYL